MIKLLEDNGSSYYPDVSTKEIDDHLDKYSRKIPKEFYDFFSKFNGWKISNPDLQLVYKFENTVGAREQLEFGCILPTDTLFLNCDFREGVSIPEGTIPFIDAQEGEIVISLRADSFGKIYFCEGNPTPDQMPEDAFETAMAKFNPSINQLPGIVVELAGSFTDFFNKVTIEEW